MLSSHSQEWGNWGPLLNRWSTTYGVYHNPPIESVYILKPWDRKSQYTYLSSFISLRFRRFLMGVCSPLFVNPLIAAGVSSLSLCGSQLPFASSWESAPFRVITGVGSLLFASVKSASRCPLFHRGSRVINPLITAGVSSLSLGVSSLRVIMGVSSLLFAGVSSLSHHHVGVSSLLR